MRNPPSPRSCACVCVCVELTRLCAASPRLPCQQHALFHHQQQQRWLQQRWLLLLLAASGLLQPWRPVSGSRCRRRSHQHGRRPGGPGYGPGKRERAQAPPPSPHAPPVCVTGVCVQMKDGRRTSSLKASYEAIKNNDFQLGRDFTLSRDGGSGAGAGGGSGGASAGGGGSGGYSSSALASTLTQTLTPSTTSDSRGRKSK